MALEAEAYVGVDAGGDADVGVAEEFLDDDEFHSLLQEELTFRARKEGVDAFLGRAGVSRSQMWSDAELPEADVAGWEARPGRKYLQGMSAGSEDPAGKPSYEVALDVTEADMPTVYVISTVVPS